MSHAISQMQLDRIAHKLLDDPDFSVLVSTYRNELVENVIMTTEDKEVLKAKVEYDGFVAFLDWVTQLGERNKAREGQT